MDIHAECPHCRHTNVVNPHSQSGLSCGQCSSKFLLCPQCSKPRAAGAVICVNCGLDFRTGKKVVASPEPRHFGDFSLYPLLPGEWTLSVRRRFLGFPVGSREFHVVGFNHVYYDTVDSWTRNVAPTAPAETTRFSLTGFAALLMPLLKIAFAFQFSAFYACQRILRSDSSSTEFFFFEIGLLGQKDKFLRLKQSQNAAEIRAIAVWLSEALGIPIVRRDRRSPD